MKKIWAYLQGVGTGKKKFPLFWVILVITLISVSYPAFHLAKTGTKLAKGVPEFAKQIVTEVYPENLQLDFKDGMMSSNVTEPYYLKIKVAKLRELMEMFDPNGGIQLPKRTEIRLLTIDSKASLEDFDRYQTLVLLTKDKVYMSNKGEVKGYGYESLGDVVITRDYLDQKLAEVFGNKWLKFGLQYGAWILIPILFLVMWGILWLHVLVMGLLVYLIGRLMQVKNWKYTRAVVVAVMVFFVYDLFEAFLNWLPYMRVGLSLFSPVWQLIAYVVIFGLLRSLTKNESKS